MFGTFYGATGIFSSLIGFAGAALYSSVDDRIQGFHYMPVSYTHLDVYKRQPEPKLFQMAQGRLRNQRVRASRQPQ